MKPHLCIFLWIVLSHCVTGDMKIKKETIGNSVGEHCDKKCNGINLICNKTFHQCQCRPDFPIVVTTNRHVLCLQPAKLGEECLDKTACLAEDENSDCMQVANNAVCRCKEDYHDVHDKSTRRHRCVPETQLLNSDLATLIGVGAGMSLFCALTCLVLRIFARARFGPRHHHYANAHLAPPITLSTDHGGEVGGPSRHSSTRSSTGGGSRRSSLLAPPKRPEGSRRASNSSIRSTGSSRSQRSYSLKNPSQNHHHHLHHRPSDPEAGSHYGHTLNPPSTSQVNRSSSGNLHSSSSPQHSHPNLPQQSPHKAKRSSSAGAI